MSPVFHNHERKVALLGASVTAFAALSKLLTEGLL